MQKYTFNLNTYLAVGAMLLGIILIDSYGIIIKSLGDTYSTTQLLVFRNVFAIIPRSFLDIKRFILKKYCCNIKILLNYWIKNHFMNNKN